MTIDPLQPDTFAQIVEALDYPACRIGVHEIAGRAQWSAVLSGHLTTPRSREQALLSFGDALLTASPGGQSRLQTYAGATVESSLVDQVYLFGDLTALPVIVDALLCVPPPVRDAALNEVAFIAVGRDSAAWCGSSQFLRRDGARLPIAIVLGPNVDADLMLHEIGHAWFSALPSAERPGAITAQGTEGLIEHAHATGWLDHIRRTERHDETLAEVCRFVWGKRR